MIDSDRITTTHALPAEEVFDRAIRPLRLDEYIGQESVREQMRIFLAAAIARQSSASTRFCSSLRSAKSCSAC